MSITRKHKGTGIHWGWMRSTLTFHKSVRQLQSNKASGVQWNEGENAEDEQKLDCVRIISLFNYMIRKRK